MQADFRLFMWVFAILLGVGTGVLFLWLYFKLFQR